MVTVVKLAIGAVVCGGIVVGSYFVLREYGRAVFKHLSMFFMPSCNYLSEDTNAEETYKDKYVGQYLNYFIGVEVNKVNNKNWWNWAFEKRYKGSKATGSFATGITDGDSLRISCQKAYNEVTTVENNNYPIDQLWKYCSSVGEKLSYIRAEKEDIPIVNVPNLEWLNIF